MGKSARRKRERAAKAAAAARSVVFSRNRAKHACLGALAVLALAATIAFTIRPFRLAGNTQRQPVATTLVKFEPGPQSLKDLLALDPAKLAGLDIARVNLLCAEGLPGAEKLNVEQCLAELDRWAQHVKAETDRHLCKFRQNPGEYENSEGYFRMLTLITVLQQDLGVHYNPVRIRDIDFTRSQDLFIHGMVPTAGQSVQQTNGGTCVSMPVIYTAIARRLGYPVKLVTTKAHVFCRWDAPDHADPAWRGRFNIEATNQGMSSFPDDYYKTWPYQVSDAEIKANRHLQSLTPAEELAEFLATRGHCLLDTGKSRGALDAYSLAVKLCPSNSLLAGFRHPALRKLYPAMAQGELDLMYSTRRRPRPDPMRDVERINAINRANMERLMRPPTLGAPQPPGVPRPHQPPTPGVPGQPPVP